MRAIIPETEQIVALDTGIAWELRNSTPIWVAMFATMREHGYHFCISDIFLAEFLNQFETAQHSSAEFRSVVQQLDRFVSPVLPVLPGKRQLYQMAGIHDPTMPPSDTPEFTELYSVATWDWIRSLTDVLSMRTTQPTYSYNGQPYVCPLQSEKVATVLQSQREEWSSSVKRNDSLPPDALFHYREDMLADMQRAVDNDATCTPPISTRLDLWLKSLLETLIQRNQSIGRFNPDASKRRNDSIDALLQLAFLLPAFICTLDTKIVSRFAPLDSFQKAWLVSPSQLANAWATGNNPRTDWPEISEETPLK